MEAAAGSAQHEPVPHIVSGATLDTGSGKALPKLTATGMATAVTGTLVMRVTHTPQPAMPPALASRRRHGGLLKQTALVPATAQALPVQV